MRFIRLYCVFLAAFCILSCTKEPEPARSSVPASGAQPATGNEQSILPVVSTGILLVPSNPNRKSTLALSADGTDLSKSKIQWFVNGSPVSSENPSSFSCAEFARGTEIEVRVTVDGREIRSNRVAIANTPPDVTSVRLVPEVFRPGDRFSVEAAAIDLDDDPVTFQYAWTKNGVPAGADARLNATVKRGDDLRVSVIAFDGQVAGTPVMVQRQIANFPPSFIEHTQFSFAGSSYVYQAQATDPDGDVVTYALAAPVDGVVINQASGLVVWTVPQEFRGELLVTLVADDGHGGTARYTVTFSVK